MAVSRAREVVASGTGTVCLGLLGKDGEISSRSGETEERARHEDHVIMGEGNQSASLIWVTYYHLSHALTYNPQEILFWTPLLGRQ